MTDDWLCGAGERTAPSTGHHTSPEFVREITSPVLVVSAQDTPGASGQNPDPSASGTVTPALGRGRPAPASITARLNGAGRISLFEQVCDMS